MGRITIDLRKDRTNGETFPQYEGMFFYVESVDLPCRVSFNLADESQSVGLSSGFQLNMPFGGFTIFHDNYSLGGLPESQAYQLVVYISREPRAFNQYVAPAVQIPLPTSQSVLGSSLRVDFPIFSRTRFFNLVATIEMNNAATPGVGSSSVEFYKQNGGLLVSPYGLVLNGVTYADRAYNYPDFHEAITLTAGALFGYKIVKQGITIPSGAVRAQLIVSPGIAVASFGFSRFYGVLI
jgi:hypothetical protein